MHARTITIAALLALASACVSPHRSIEVNSTNAADSVVADAVDAGNGALSDAAATDATTTDSSSLPDGAAAAEDVPVADAVSATVADVIHHPDTSAADTSASVDIGATADGTATADSGATPDITEGADSGATTDTATSTDAAGNNVADGAVGTDAALNTDTGAGGDAVGLPDAGTKCTHPMTCPGAGLPAFKASQVHPKAKSYKKVIGLDAFKGTPTLVALLAAW